MEALCLLCVLLLLMSAEVNNEERHSNRRRESLRQNVLWKAGWATLWPDHRERFDLHFSKRENGRLVLGGRIDDWKGAWGDHAVFLNKKGRVFGGFPRNRRLESHRSRRTKDPERSSLVGTGSLSGRSKTARSSTLLNLHFHALDLDSVRLSLFS